MEEDDEQQQQQQERVVWALEMQAPWSAHVVGGRKTIETRRYPLPDFIRLPTTIAIVQPAAATPGMGMDGGIDRSID